MAPLAKIYGKTFKDDFRYYFTHWLPNAKLEIGTVGELVDGYLFRPLSTLADEGITFSEDDILPDTSPSPMRFSSKSGVKTFVKLAGEVNPNLPNVPTVEAGLKIEFENEGSFVMEAAQSFEPRMRTVSSIESQIKEAYDRGDWKDNYVVVFSVVQTPYADILISEAAGSSIEFGASANGTVGTVELGNANLGFGIRQTTGRVLDLRKATDVTPAVQLVGLKRSWLLGPKEVQPLAVPSRGRATAAAEVHGLGPRDRSDTSSEVLRLELLSGDDLV